MNLQKDFINCIHTCFGEKGKQWIKKLPGLLNKCEEKFEIKIRKPVSNLSFNYVAYATTKEGEDVVLKIGFPHNELFSEMEALLAFKGHDVVKLLKKDKELGAMLLERIKPATTLKEMYANDDKKATQIAAKIICDLPINVPKLHSFPTVMDWVKDEVQSSIIPNEAIDRAKSIAAELDASKKEDKLLHGDLHHENIILDYKRGWITIDPYGVIGDPAFNAARFMRNPQPNLLDADNPKKITEHRLKYLSDILNCDPKRIAGWGYVDCITGACWSVEGGGYQWKSSMACAEILLNFL